MPIINMASSEEDAKARGLNVRSIDANGDGKITVWLYDTHHGMCISDRERNGYDDSDWYMLVWNEEKQEPEEICFASTRGWTYPCYGSRPDATPEVMAKYNAWCVARDARVDRERDERQSKIPTDGKIVEVVAGRKVPKGKYYVHHTMRDQYRGSRYSAMAIGMLGIPAVEAYHMRLALQPLRADGARDLSAPLVWTADSNVVVVNPEQYRKLRTEEAVCA